MYSKEISLGQDNSCKNTTGHYAQRVTLINKNNVKELYHTKNGKTRILLKDHSKTTIFISPNRGNDIVAWVNKKNRDGMPVYQHNITLPVTGNNLQTKIILDSLDNAEFFAIVTWLDAYNQTNHIYGYHNGLTTQDYEYNPANMSGGGIITLASEELFLPYIEEN